MGKRKKDAGYGHNVLNSSVKQMASPASITVFIEEFWIK